MKKQRVLTDFAIGLIVGFVAAAIIFGSVMCIVYVRNKDKEKIIYVERQQIIEELREDYSTRAVDEFLEIPDVRRAADGASDEFIRKRDEILQRFRSRITD